LELIRKGALLREFEVEGSFYNVKIRDEVFECRNQAKIKKIGITHNHLDAIFIMVNPGGSNPAEQILTVPNLDSRETEIPFVKAESDQTQWQLMRLMKIKKWEQISIINLSDIRSGNMKVFKKELKRAKDLSFDYHSIFSEQREQELKDVLRLNNGPIVAAWGTDSKIKNMAGNVLLSKNIENFKGWKHQDHPYYYHPKPALDVDKIEWLEKLNYILV
jgi:hypothetical protein